MLWIIGLLVGKKKLLLTLEIIVLICVSSSVVSASDITSHLHANKPPAAHSGLLVKEGKYLRSQEPVMRGGVSEEVSQRT